MPVASFKPSVVTTPEVTLPTVEPASYKSIITDDAYTPLTSLITYVEGAPWTVQYYSQVLSQHQDLRDFDPSQANLYQQYTKIVNYEIRVNTPLTSSQDNETAATTVTGEALAYPCVTPNVGDLFIAETGDNHDGLFRITNVERKNFNRDSVFMIEYMLVTWIDIDNERYSNLEAKVTRTYYFSKDRLLEGLNPNVIESEHQELKDLHNGIKEVTQYYFKTFFNREFSTLTLPGQTVSVYDAYLVDYLLKIVDPVDAYEVRFVKNLSTDQESYHRQPQFWEALLMRDYGYLTQCNTQMTLIGMRTLMQNPALAGIQYSGIQYLVYPKDVDYSVFSGEPPLLRPDAMASLQDLDRPAMSLSNLNRDVFVDQNRTIPYVNSILADSYYVFSEAFYKDQIATSIIEGLTMDYLKIKALDLTRLHGLFKNYRYWNRLTQFYYLPILLTLMKAAMTQ